MTKRFLIGFLLISQSVMLFAQVPGKPNKLDETYTPAASLATKSSSSPSSSSDGFDVRNNVKFNLGLLTRSIAAFEYERFLIDEISLIGGLGVAYGKDLFMSIASQMELDILETSSSSYSLSSITNKGVFAGNKNLYASLGIRFYWDTYDNNRLDYVELGTRYYNNTLRIDDSSVNGSPLVDVTNNNYYMKYGTQVVTTGRVKTVHDFYMGFGVRGTSYNVFENQEFIDSFGNSRQELIKSQKRERIFTPSIIMGYSFGFGF
jgi:hypothetical protein